MWLKGLAPKVKVVEPWEDALPCDDRVLQSSRWIGDGTYALPTDRDSALLRVAPVWGASDGVADE